MSEQGEISVANHANFENAPKFVIMNGEGGQKLFIMNDKMNNELIKDLYEEYSKPKIDVCENEILRTNDGLNDDDRHVKKISLINEPDNRSNVLNSSVGKEVTVSVTLKIKNESVDSKSTENDDSKTAISDNKDSIPSNNDAIVTSKGSKNMNVNENNSVVTKQDQARAVNESNVNSFTISGNKDSKCNFKENDELDLGKNENTDTDDNKKDSLKIKQENTDIKQKDTDVSKIEFLGVNHENKGIITGERMLNSPNETSNCSTLPNVDPPRMSASQQPNEEKGKSSPVNAVNKVALEFQNAPPHATTNEATESEHSTTPILTEKANPLLDNQSKINLNNVAVNNDQTNSQELASILPTNLTPTTGTFFVDKTVATLSKETNNSPKLVKNVEQFVPFINNNQDCDSGKKANPSENDSVISTNNVSALCSTVLENNANKDKNNSFETVPSSSSPVLPFASATSSEPVTSSKLAASSAPSASSEPSTSSSEPSTSSSEPVKSCKPAASSKPETSSEPVTSCKPATPSVLTTSSEPVTPSKPAKSSAPAASSEPSTSSEPVTSSEPPTPSEPATSTKPAGSTAPVTLNKEAIEISKIEVLANNSCPSVKTSTSTPVNTNAVNISKEGSDQTSGSSDDLVITKEDEIVCKDSMENVTESNDEKLKIDVDEIATTATKVIDNSIAANVNFIFNESLPKVNNVSNNEISQNSIKVANDVSHNNMRPTSDEVISNNVNQLASKGICIVSPESSISLEDQCSIDRSRSNEIKLIKCIETSLVKSNDCHEKSVTIFQENNLKKSNEIIGNQEVPSCNPNVKETENVSAITSSQIDKINTEAKDNELPNDISKINLAVADNNNLQKGHHSSSNEKITPLAPPVVKNENDKLIFPSNEISDTKIDYQRNGTKIDENLMKKINETLINLFIETTNNKREFDPTSVKEVALMGFMKLYGKELVAQVERYQKQVDDLSMKLAEKQQEAKDLAVELKEAKKAMLKKDSSEQQRYEIQIDQLKTTIREEETRTESVRVELQYARNEVEFSQAKMRRLEEDLTKANELSDSLREQNANRSRDSARLKELEEQVKSLEDKLRKSECTRKDLETSLAEIETERDEEMKIVQDALDEAAEERQELITSFKKELELLNTTNTAREQQMLDDFEWKLHEMEKDYKSKLEDNNRQAENTLQRAKRHNDEEEIRQNSEKQRNEINAEWEDKLRKECSRLKAELDDLNSEEKHLAVESMKVQKEQEIQRLRKSWERRQDEMATQVSSLKDSLADKDAYYHRELDNQRTMSDRDLWDLRMKLQKLTESSYDQKQQLEEKYREDMERLRVDYDERIRELESRLAICDAEKGVDLISQMEKEHKMQMTYVGEQHQLSMERLREELEAEKFQAVEDTRVLISNLHVETEANLKEQLSQMKTNESQIRDELEAIRSSLQRREETLKNVEEELERYKDLKGDSSYSSTNSCYPPATSTTSSGFNSSQFSLSSNDSQGSRNSQDRYSYHDSVSLAESQDDSQRNGGLLGKVFGGGWFTPSKSYSRRGSTPLSNKKPYT